MMIRLATVLAILVLVSGCVLSTGHGPAFHGSTVKLTEGNFTVEQQGVTGEAQVTVLFGQIWEILMSIGFNPLSFDSVSGIPLGNTDLISTAAEDLKAGAGIDVGTKKHLVNMAQDYKTTVWFPLLVSTKSVKLTADVIAYK